MILINKSKNQEPLVSIITVTLNSEKYLEETLKSIENQKNKDYEVIIIDGSQLILQLKLLKDIKFN